MKIKLFIFHVNILNLEFHHKHKKLFEMIIKNKFK